MANDSPNEFRKERDRPLRAGREPGDEVAGDTACEHNGLGEELRVQRAEEELDTGIRTREAGSVRVRKTVHTDHEEFRVPRRYEEVEIERVPVEGEAREAPEGTELGEDEVVMRIYEEEVMVSKRVVLKEEIRLHKEVVEKEEIIEEDIRREEVEIDDQTKR